MIYPCYFSIFFLLGSENEGVEPAGKKRKIQGQCPSCLETFKIETLNRHIVNCESYQKLITNEKQCSVCEKQFETKRAVNQHISMSHKDKLVQLRIQK